MHAFYRREHNRFVASVHTRGPWDEGAQHGGPPSALLLRVMREAVAERAGPDFTIARLSTEFLRPVPIAPLQVGIDTLRSGRTAVRVTATLSADRDVMTASALFLRRSDTEDVAAARRPGHEDPAWPAPEDVAPFVFPFFTSDEGYHRAVELKLLDPPWGTTPVRFWGRPLLDLIEGEPTLPEENTVILADAESGMGPPLDPFTYTYVNPDLTVYFARVPRPGYLGLDILSLVGDAGAGISEARLRDDEGVFGRSAQATVVARR
jgi:hypothetical protein